MLFRFSRLAMPLAVRWVSLGLASAGLAGCGTTQAPQVDQPQAALSRPEPATPPVSATPLSVESAAVAARFPDPEVSYRTPAFQESRTTFTTQAELQALMKKIASADGKDTPSAATLLTIGKSQSGVPIDALVFTRHPNAKPATLLRGSRPTVLLIGQQHGDEPASAEALLVLAQELVAGGSQHSLLERINVIVVPRANPDGAALQQSMTANGIDINRDHLLLRTPEARALAKLMQDFQPAVVLDSHEYAVQPLFVEKFGAAQRFDALMQYATTMNEPEFVTKAAEEWFRRPMFAGLKPLGLTADWHHATSNALDDKKVSMGGVQPDVARNVIGLRNAVSLMVETRGVGLGTQHLKRRVQTQLSLMSTTLRSAADRAPDLMKLRQYVDNSVRAQACQGKMVVEASLSPSEYTLQMIDPATGADKAVVVNWDSALVLADTKTRPRPCGYWLAADQADAVSRLRALGVKVERFSDAAPVQADAAPKGKAAKGFDAPVDSYYVPLSQPLGNLVVAALESKAAHGYLANGVVTAPDRIARVTTWPKGKRTPVP